MPPMQKLLNAKTLALALAGFIEMRTLIHFQGELLPSAAIACILALFLCLIWFGDWFAANLLPMGRLSRAALDYDSAALQGPIVALLGWILLALMFVMTMLWNKAETPAVSQGPQTESIIGLL